MAKLKMPKDYRLLKTGERLEKEDIYRVGLEWIPINNAWIGFVVNKKCRPGARKKEK